MDEYKNAKTLGTNFKEQNPSTREYSYSEPPCFALRRQMFFNQAFFVYLR